MLNWSRRAYAFAQKHPLVWSLLFSLAVILPGIVAVLSMVGVDWYPTGDISHTELMLRSFPSHPPLIGVAARVGDDINNQGSTPGASMAYLMLPVYLLFLRTSFALLLSTLIVHIAAIVGALYVTKKIAGIKAVVFLAFVLAVMVRSLAPDFFLEPWNVWLPVFAFALFLLLIWGVALGRHAMLPAAVGVGFFCLQTHISYVPMVIGLLVLATVWTIYLSRRPAHPTVLAIDVDSSKVLPMAGWKRSIGWSVMIGGLMWIPPVIEQTRPGTGNLRRLWEHFSDPPTDTVGLKAAVKAMMGELNLAGPFLTGSNRAPTDAPNLVGFAAFVIVVLVGMWAAYARRDRAVATLQAVMAVATAIGLVATARIFGTFYDYVIRWMWILAVIWLAVSLWAIALWWRDSGSLRRLGPRTGFVAGAIVALAVVNGAVSSVGAEPPGRNDSRLVGGLAPQLDLMLASSNDYLLRWHDPAALGGPGFGLLLEMEKRDVRLFVDSWAGAAARQHRVRAESDVDSVLWLVTGAENIATFARRNDAVKIASFDPRSAAEQVESDRLRTAIEAEMLALGHPEWITLLDSQYGHLQILYFTPVPASLFDQVERYREIRLPGAIFEVPSGAALFP